MGSSEEHSLQSPPSIGAKVSPLMIMILLVLLGIILIWIGQLTIAAANWEKTDEMRVAYKNHLIITGAGAMIFSIALIGGALTIESMDKFVRLGMIIAAAYILAQLFFRIPYIYYYP